MDEKKRYERRKIYTGDLFGETGLLKEWIDFIYCKVLSAEPIRVKEIQRIIKENYSLSCDDSILCAHKNKGSFKNHGEAEWRHQVRWCLSHMKDNGRAIHVERGYYAKGQYKDCDCSIFDNWEKNEEKRYNPTQRSKHMTKKVCGFCKSEVNKISEMTMSGNEGGIIVYCCENCGAVLGIVQNYRIAKRTP